MYKLGEIIEIIKMVGEPQYTGKKGTITSIDDLGQLHGTWGGLAIDTKVDKIRIVKEV